MTDSCWVSAEEFSMRWSGNSTVESVKNMKETTVMFNDELAGQHVAMVNETLEWKSAHPKDKQSTASTSKTPERLDLG